MGFEAALGMMEPAFDRAKGDAQLGCNLGLRQFLPKIQTEYLPVLKIKLRHGFRNSVPKGRTLTAADQRTFR